MQKEEFHCSPEDWPQPEDDRCTLSQDRSATIPWKKKPKSSMAKARKKMTEGVARSAIAVVGVAVIAGALPEVVPEPDPMLPACPLCQRVECSYWPGVDSYPSDNPPTYGLVEVFDSVPVYTDADGLYSMTGFTADDVEYVRSTGSVFAGDKRLVLRLSSDIDAYVGYANYISNSAEAGWGHDQNFCYYVSYDQMHGAGSADGTSVDATNFFMVALASSSGDSIPDCIAEYAQHAQGGNSHVNLLPQDLRRAVIPVEGFPDVQLQFATNIPDLDMEIFISLVNVEIVERNLTYPLGQTMIFRESEEIFRNYIDGLGTACWRTYASPSERFIQNLQLHYKYYTLRNLGYTSWNVLISDVNWNDVFSRWQALNDEAPTYGHEILFPLEKQERVEFNGIMYDCYACYLPMDPQYELFGDNVVDYYFVPAQEPTVAFWHENYDPRELEYSLQNQCSIVNDKGFRNPLQNITLR